MPKAKPQQRKPQEPTPEDRVERRGGARPTAGRKSRVERVQKSMREKFPMLPLEYMLTVLNNKKAPPEERAEMAKAAAPYVHPRLSSVEMKLKNTNLQQTIDVAKFTDEQLATFERLLSVAQITAVDESYNQQQPTMLEHLPNAVDDSEMLEGVIDGEVITTIDENGDEVE